VLAQTHAAAADARQDYLLRLLGESSQFRVRAQAAVSLGSVDPNSKVVDGLIEALADDHPAVRAAAANSLGRLGDRRALEKLQRAARDREAPVSKAASAAIARLERSGGGGGAAGRASASGAARPQGPARFYVAIGKTAAKSKQVPAAAVAEANRAVRDEVEGIAGVVVAPVGERPAQAKAALRKRKLTGYFIESSVTSVESKPGGGSRVAVSVIVATYPGRDMRAILSGAATAFAGGNSTAQAAAAAVRSALRKLPQAMR